MKPEQPRKPPAVPSEITDQLSPGSALASADVKVDDGEEAVGAEEAFDPVDDAVEVGDHRERVGHGHEVDGGRLRVFGPFRQDEPAVRTSGRKSLVKETRRTGSHLGTEHGRSSIRGRRSASWRCRGAARKGR